MSDTLTAAEFELRVSRASERIDEIRGKERVSSLSPAALPYAGIDLGAAVPEMVDVLGALLSQGPEEALTHNARIEVAARRVSLALLTHLMQSGYGMADLSERYEAVVGDVPDLNGLARILTPALREAGFPLSGAPDARRILEQVMGVVGLSPALLRLGVEYFVIFWTRHYPCSDALAPLQEALSSGEHAARLKELAAILVPNGSVIRPLVESLTRLMLGLRTQARWRVGDLFTASAEIEAWCGVNPKFLLRQDEAVLSLLIEALSGVWHPDQFRHVLMLHPRGSEVRLPSGALAMVDKAIAVPQWGTYQIERKQYVVLPNEGWTFDELLKPAGASASDGLVIWREDVEAPILADEFPQPWIVRTTHDAGTVQSVFVQVLPPGVMVSSKTHSLSPREGLVWDAQLRAQSQGDDKRFALELVLDGVRLCLPELAGSTLQLEIPRSETAGRLCFELDNRGCAALPRTVLSITEAQSGACDVYLQDHATGALVSKGQQLLGQVPVLGEVMLFNERTGLPIAPSEKLRGYGVQRYLLFAARPINVGAMQAQDIDVSQVGRAGAYDVYRLSWTEAGQSLEIRIDGRYQWHFNQRVERGWEASDLPAAPRHLGFLPNGPDGLMVANGDDLLVDDLSHVGDRLLVVVERNQEPLFAHTWRELNWLMNFPLDNRRFSGAMLRRALHVGPEFDLAGQYTLSLTVAGEILDVVNVTILPQFKLVVTPDGLQDEDCHYVLEARSDYPIFGGRQRQVTLSLGQAVVDRDAMESSPFAPRPLESSLRLEEPRVAIRVQVEPEIGGYRLLDENEGSWIRKANLQYDELDYITLVLFAPNGVSGTLCVGDEARYTEEFYEGFATFSLASLQGALTQSETQVEVAIDGIPKGSLTIFWHPKVLRFELANEYLVDHVAQVDLTAVGPVNIPLRLEAYAPNGKRLAQQVVDTEGSLSRIVNFQIPNAREFPVVTIKVFDPSEASGAASGSLEVRNASFEPEVEALNARIAAEPQLAELRHERAQLLLSKGLRKAAARDFQAAVDLGMKEILESPQYQQFLTERRAEGFYEDIKALASFFVPFARKELSVG
jgi:hypothetical protein